MQILAAEAGANGNVAKQKEYLDQLVTQYPNDERAHFNLGGYYFGQQDYPNAIEQYNKVIRLTNDRRQEAVHVRARAAMAEIMELLS